MIHVYKYILQIGLISFCTHDFPCTHISFPEMIETVGSSRLPSKVFMSSGCDYIILPLEGCSEIMPILTAIRVQTFLKISHTLQVMMYFIEDFPFKVFGRLDPETQISLS